MSRPASAWSKSKRVSPQIVLASAVVLLASAMLASAASAFVALPSGVMPVVTPPPGGGLVKLSNGEYALYGAGGEEAQAMKLYSSADEATLTRRATGLEVDSGVTGQDASAVEGATTGDVEAVDAMHAELVADGSEQAANGVVNDVTEGSRALGVLPDLGEIGGALAGGVEIAGGAVAVVAIATGIDEVLGLPTLFDAPAAEESTLHGYIRLYEQAASTGGNRGCATARSLGTRPTCGVPTAIIARRSASRSMRRSCQSNRNA